MEMTKIRQFWDFFVLAESSSYEKSSWCDLFLCQLIVDLNDGKSVEDILTFCNRSGIGTLIGCELLSDIDQVCSEPGDGEDLRPLRRHLFAKGWRALVALSSLDQQNFSCSNELANLLISLFPICLEAKGGSEAKAASKRSNKYLHLNMGCEVDSCFASSPLSTAKFSGPHGQLAAARTDYFRSHANPTNARSRRVTRGSLNNTRWNADIQSSESENPCDDFNVLNKSFALKIKLDPTDFDYFACAVHSDDDSRLDSVLYEPRRRAKHSKKISPFDFIDDKIQDVMQSHVSPYEFTMLVIQLLISLCRSESSFAIATENSYPVCLKSVKFALENLCSIQFGSVSSQSLESREAANLKSALTQLLVISLGKVMSCPDVTTNVILTGILPMTLRVLEDSVCKISSDIELIGTKEEEKDSYEKEKQHQVIFGLMCSVITFLFSLLMQNSDADRVRNFLELFKIFIESNNGKLIEKTVVTLARLGNLSRAKKVIDLIGQLIAGLKKVRKDIVNPHLCKKFKQKKFKDGNELHHHHDLFGAVFTTPIVGSNCPQNCCVSSLFLVLVRLLGKPHRIPTEIINRILKTMNSCGTCCCFATKNLLQSLLEIIKSPSQKSRILVFQLLENTLYSELGCYSTLSGGKSTCLVCLKHTAENNNQKLCSLDENFRVRYLAKDVRGDLMSVNSENSFLGDFSSLEASHQRKTPLKLELFRDLLSSEDFRLVQEVTFHLLKCAPKMTQSGKSTVLFDIFLPTFLSSKTQFFSERDEISIFRILSSLSMFSSLLSNLTFAQQFINKKGLDHVLDLISESVFTGNCCAVLEKTIIMSVLISDVGEVAGVPSLATLRSAVDAANRLFLKHFDESEETLAVEISNFPMGLKRKLPNAKKLEEKKNKKMMDILENVSAFWKTYANLTLCSPILRKYFSGKTFLADCNKLLEIALFFMTNKLNAGREKNSKSRDGTEACLFIKLIESLLMFILATSGGEENGDEENKIVIEQLSRSLLVSDLRNVDVRKLAEVLLKCSLVQPSQFQIIPTDSAPKLLFAPLWSTCGDVSDADENEEKLFSESESVDDNYVTADEGYDADVEVRDNLTSPGEVFDEKSLHTVTDSIEFLSRNDSLFEKSDQRTGHLIVYPKLCLLSIDLLIKLYQEKYEDRSDKDVQTSERSSCERRLHFGKSVAEEAEEEKISKFKESRFPSEGESILKNLCDGKESKMDKKQMESRLKAEGPEEMCNDAEEKYLIGLISIFQRLVSLCRDKAQNCAILCKNNVILKLLRGFEGCFIERKESFSELQKSALDLITILAKHSITPEELSIYLSFFKRDNPPLDQLINPLLNLVTSYSPQPNYSLLFPVAIPLNFIHNSITDFGKNIHVQHKNEGVISCWSLSAASLPIGSELNWAVWAQGFSLSLWLKIDKSAIRVHSSNARAKSPYKDNRKFSKAESQVSACSTAVSATSDVYLNENLPFLPSKPISPDDLLHVFSIGNDGLTLECWCAPDSQVLIWRLSKINVHRGYEVIAEKTVENCLPPSLWNHLAINVKDSVIRKKTIVQVGLIVNGGNEVHIPLPFSGLLVRRYRPSSLLLGTQGDCSAKRTFSVSSIMLFTTPVFTRERAVYLLGLGPNCTNLTDCHIGRRRPNFTSVFSMKNLASEIDWETVLDSKQGIMREVQSHLLIIYSAENPHAFNVYPSSSGVNSSTLFGGLRSISSETRATQQTPVSLVPCIFAPLIQQKYQGLIPSAYILGGSATFMFLFARVVELSSDPDEQAKFLFLLLKFVQSDCELFTQFVKSEHHNMLHKIFSVSKCVSGLHILKAILDACCDKPVILNTGGRFQVIHQSDSIIVNSFLITTILSSWKDWSPAMQANEVVELLFSALLALLKDDHPHREFNVAQLNRVQMVNGLLSFTKERLLYDDKKALTTNVCVSLVELVKSLMGAPPEFSHIVAVMDCLILLHPVNATFVTHVKNSFYILLSAGQTYCTKGSNHETKPKGKIAESDGSKNGSYQFLDNWIFNVNFNSQVKKLAKKHNSRQAVDSSKLNKSLTNLQKLVDILAEEIFRKHHTFRQLFFLCWLLQWFDCQSKWSKWDATTEEASRGKSWRNVWYFLKISSARMSTSSSARCSTRRYSPKILKRHTVEIEKRETMKIRHRNEQLDSNRYSDDLTFDSGIAGSFREAAENLDETDGVMAKVIDGSRQNLRESFFPSGSFSAGSEKNANSYFEISDEEENYASEKERREMERREKCEPQCVIVEGLLLLLRDVILVLPDSMAHQILNHVVKPEFLLVMANHKDHRVRSAVVRVFSSYLQRSSDEDVNKFIKLRGFFHLANQISLYPASQRLAEDCLHLLTRRDVSLEADNFPSDHEIHFFGMAALPPLLALLPRSVHDFSLAHNLIGIIRQIYCRDEFASKVLLENGLVETLVKTLIASAHFSSDANEETRQSIILTDLVHFFIVILNKALNTSGVANMQIVSDIRIELNYVMRLEKENCGLKSRCARIVRDAFCKILEKSLDLMQNKINSLQTIHKWRNSIFSSVLNGVQEDQAESERSEGFDSVDGCANEFANSVCYPTKEISRSELSERFKVLVVNAVEFLVFSDDTKSRSSSLSQTELGFVYHLLPMLLKILSSNLEKRNSNRRHPCSGIYWAVRETLKAETFELLTWLMSPRQTVKIRMFAVVTLMSQSNCKNLLSHLLQASNQAEQKFAAFLWDLMYNNKLGSADSRSCQELKESVQRWAIISPRSVGNSNDSWGENCRASMSESDRQLAAWEKQMEAAGSKCLGKYDLLVKGMSEDAVAMTRLVVDAQNTERKSFMEEMKTHCSENVHILLKWRDLIGKLTHEKAVWHFEESHPTFWQLDPTEGPSRVRKRLARCRLEMDERYFLPSERRKLKREKNPSPLSILFEEESKCCTSMVLIERLHCNEKIRTMFSAKIVTPAAEIPGELLIGETSIYFVAEDKHKFHSMDVSNTAWLFEEVKEIHDRRYELQERAIEIFLVNGNTYFIALDTSKERDALMAELTECDFPNRISGDNLPDIMQLWREGLLTNWEYLTQLNKLAGRSYNDLMQYPVYPFVLSDYSSPSLDLNDRSVYRNFRKPMAVQEKKNEQHYIDNYNELLGGLKQVSLNKEPYHYGSHYSNSGTVLHFLVRLPPFTKMLLQYQDRNFDLPDRTFHSLHTTWRLASSESTTDVKEMIPEFFFLPEFLTNFQRFNFGVRQNGEMVDDVLLPPWCKNDPRRFVLAHRQALESDHVTENLPHWIDLVFGFKQTGKAAVDAINVFHPATYCGFDVESIADPVERIAWETMVKTYGQTPKQLLKAPHPLVVQSLISGSNSFGHVADDVKGLKWGSYVGSPAEPEPAVVWRQQCKGKEIVASLLALATNDVLGLPPFSACLVQYEKAGGSGIVNSNGVRAALLSWGYSDGIIRMKLRRELPLTPLVSITQWDPVTICVGEPACNHLWIGHSSGNLTVYKFKFAPDQESVDFSEIPVLLQGHGDSVACIAISRAFSVAVTSAMDGQVIVWDLNRVSYVRSLAPAPGPAKIVAVSETLGDIAVAATRSGPSTCLHLYTVNAALVGSVAVEETVTSMCFSTAPEGTSINVVACGLANGVVRLFSTWDLTQVRDVSVPSLKHSVTGLAYSCNSQLLYASFRDGTIVVWESSATKSGIKTSKFFNLKL